MKDNRVKLTKVWKINGDTLVIADTIPEAIEVYKAYYESCHIEKVELIPSQWNYEYALMLDKSKEL